MSFTRRFRARRRIVIACVFAGMLTGCATRHPEAIVPPAPVASTVVWRLEPGDILHARVFRNPDLNADPIISPNGTAFFPGLGRVAAGGIKLDSLEALLNARYAQLVREPAVQVTMDRDVTLYGQIRAPGVYPADPGMTLLAVVARAGGQSATSGNERMLLETADGRQFVLPREARIGSIDLHRDDAVYFEESSFFLRNASAISATQIIVTTLTAVIGLVLVLSR